jgi:hypothetical protein
MLFIIMVCLTVGLAFRYSVNDLQDKMKEYVEEDRSIL